MSLHVFSPQPTFTSDKFDGNSPPQDRHKRTDDQAHLNQQRGLTGPTSDVAMSNYSSVGIDVFRQESGPAYDLHHTLIVTAILNLLTSQVAMISRSMCATTNHNR